MNKFEFICLCEEHLIDPDIALENEDLRKALTERDDIAVERILTEEF